MFRGYDPEDGRRPPDLGWYDPRRRDPIVPVYVPPQLPLRRLSCDHTVEDDRPVGTRVWCLKCEHRTAPETIEGDAE